MLAEWVANLATNPVCEFRLSEVFAIRAPNLRKVLKIYGIYGAQIFACEAMALGLCRNSQTANLGVHGSNLVQLIVCKKWISSYFFVPAKSIYASNL